MIRCNHTVNVLKESEPWNNYQCNRGACWFYFVPETLELWADCGRHGECPLQGAEIITSLEYDRIVDMLEVMNS